MTRSHLPNTMHLPYPSRKSSNPTPFLPRRATTSRLGQGFTIPRRYRQRAVLLALLSTIALIWLLTHAGSGESTGKTKSGTVGMVNHKPTGQPPVVIVTVLDEQKFGAKYTQMLRENRKLYAEKHGYATMFPRVGDYDLNRAPASWTKVVAMRHAMTEFPDATYLWYVDVDTFIMSPGLAIDGDVMAAGKLEDKMLVDVPVVPPDSIIHTFSHLKGRDVDLVVAQDHDGLVTSSFVLRNSEWSRFFVETWFDPIYRSYNFQKAETHALEHIVQWHPTILAKLALVPQRLLVSYDKPDRGDEYQTGDLAVRFPKCIRQFEETTCEQDAEPYANVWRAAYRNR